MKIDPQISLVRRSMVAVEMGGDWFKLVHILHTRQGPKLKKLVLKPSSELDAVSGSDLRKVCALDDLKKQPVIACVPRQMVNVRLLDLPSGDPREIADMIDLQIARQTPYSREEIVYDYRLVKSVREGYTRVMLVIAQVGQIRQRVRLLEEAGLDVSIVSVSTDGWLGAMRTDTETADDKSGQVAFLDLDSTYGDFLVLQNGLPLFSRSIPVGMRDLSSDPKRYETRLTQELARAMETFRNEHTASNVKRLVLSGAAAGGEGLVALLQEGLKVPVDSVRGPARLEGAWEDPHLDQVSITGLVGAATVPEGLQINLLPESVGLRKDLSLKARRMTTTVLLIMAALALLSLWGESHLQRREVYLAQLDRMVRETSRSADEVDAMRRKVNLVAARVESKMIPVAALVELHDVAGDRMAFTAIEINRADQMTCRGTADSGADVIQLVNALESSPRFKNVKTTRTEKGKSGVEFEIACDMERKQP